jgi:hypothetical protein
MDKNKKDGIFSLFYVTFFKMLTTGPRFATEFYIRYKFFSSNKIVVGNRKREIFFPTEGNKQFETI